MKLLIADDNAQFRRRLAAILSEIEGVEMVAEAEDVQEAIDTIEKTKPDAAILDIHMPGGNGLDIIPHIKTARRSPVVIMLTVGPRSEYQTVSYLEGADYFFEKTRDLRNLFCLIKHLAKMPAAHSLEKAKP